MRFLLSFAAALGVSYLLFVLMQYMITRESGAPKGVKEYQMVDFIRMDRNLELKQKERKNKPLPKPKTMPDIPKPTASRPQAPKPDNIQMAMPAMKMPLSLSKNFSLGDAGFSGMGNGLFEGNVIPLVRVPPRYPIRAKKLHLEGYVKLAFIIDEAGLVESVEVLESQPKGIFDKAAINAIKRWKFKAKIENGKPLKQKASQVIEFKLDGQ